MFCRRAASADGTAGAALQGKGENGRSTAVFPFFNGFWKNCSKCVTFCCSRASKWCNCKTKAHFVAWQERKKDGTGNFGEKGEAR